MKTFVVSNLVYEIFNNMKIKRNEVILHVDGDKRNCALNNLKLLSKSEYEAMQYDKGIRKAPKYDYYGEILTAKEIAKRNNISADTLNWRMRVGKWGIYEAAEIPVGTLEKKERIRLWT